MQKGSRPKKKCETSIVSPDYPQKGAKDQDVAAAQLPCDARSAGGEGSQDRACGLTLELPYLPSPRYSGERGRG